jgi:two-component system LytT family response regulator
MRSFRGAADRERPTLLATGSASLSLERREEARDRRGTSSSSPRPEEARSSFFSAEREPRIRTVVVGHKPEERRQILLHLCADPRVEVVAECGEAYEAVRTIDAQRPDLLLLEAEMPGLDGFGIVRALEQGPPPAVVFVAASDRHAIRAFEASAIDYLLKPVSPDRLRRAVERGQKALERVLRQATAVELVELLRQVRRYPEWLLVRAEGGSRFVSVKDIDWIESKRNDVLLHVGPSSYVHHDTTSGIERRLDPARFLRIHRSAIVNIDRIQEIQPQFEDDCAVVLKSGAKLTMGRSYRRRLKAFRRFIP